ncbi:MAG: glutathione S-transferase family protein [Alphaproteobacteria bacterium]|nr:MAG: glutathione S-transferase family protein [Alphaproteobacteria bacterium]
MSTTLYGAALSPHVAKVLIQIRHKGLDIPMVAPPGGVASDEYKKISPLGKVPCLVVDGESLYESRAICEYLEMTETAQPMRSKDPLQRAREVAIASIADLYISENLAPLFPMLDPHKRIDIVVERQVEFSLKGLRALEGAISAPYAAGDTLTLADCSVAPYLFFAIHILPVYGVADPLKGLPKVSAYWAAIQDVPAIKSVLDGMAAAAKPYLG